MKIINKILIFVLFMSIIISSTANAISPEEILKETGEKQKLFQNSYILKIESTIYEEDKTDSSKLKVYIYEGGKRQMATFTAPQRLTNNRYLVIGHNTWMYKKGLHRPIRVSARQKLFGDAGIGETVGIDYYQDYKIEDFKTENENYILELSAKDKKTAYQKATLTITKDGHYLKKIILKAVNENPLKEIQYKNYRKIGEHEVADLVIKNLLYNKNRRTELKYTNIIEKKLPIRAFQPLMMGKFDLLVN